MGHMTYPLIRLGLGLGLLGLVCACGGRLEISDAVPDAYSADICEGCEDDPGIFSGDDGVMSLTGLEGDFGFGRTPVRSASPRTTSPEVERRLIAAERRAEAAERRAIAAERRAEQAYRRSGGQSGGQSDLAEPLADGGVDAGVKVRLPVLDYTRGIAPAPRH